MKGFISKKIACLGWGSLIWDPKELPVRKPWFKDGPLLPIEFARQSQGHRITLVIEKKSEYVRSLWALMSVNDLKLAKMELKNREGIKEGDVGFWTQSSSSTHNFVETIRNWAIQKELDAVIWTALPPKFEDQIGKVPLVEDVISFLCKLEHGERGYAEEYIRNAPLQIDTNYRRRIEKEFHWTPLANY